MALIFFAVASEVLKNPCSGQDSISVPTKEKFDRASRPDLYKDAEQSQSSTQELPTESDKVDESRQYARLRGLLAEKSAGVIESILGAPFEMHKSTECRRACFQQRYDALFSCTAWEKRFHFSGIEVVLGIEESTVTYLSFTGLRFSHWREAFAAFGIATDRTPVGIPDIPGRIAGNARWTPCDRNAFYRINDVEYSVEFFRFPDSGGWLTFRDDISAPGSRKPKTKTPLY